MSNKMIKQHSEDNASEKYYVYVPKNIDFFMLSYITCTNIGCCIHCGYHSLIGTGHFVMLPLNMTYLHCLQHSLFEHLFNLYYHLQHFCQCRVAVLKNRPVLAFYVVIYLIFLYLIFHTIVFQDLLNRERSDFKKTGVLGIKKS